MKNDLDFLKDKIENSGVKAPEDMDEAYVAKTLEGVTPQPAVMPEKPKRRRKAAAIAISATAAGLVLVITLGIVLRGFIIPRSKDLSLPGGLELRQFQTRDQVTAEIERLSKNNSDNGVSNFLNKGVFVEEDMAADGAVAPESGNSYAENGSSGSSAESYSETYKQVEGVDEADIIKTDGKYIYCVDNHNTNGNKVVIFTAEGDKSKKAAEIIVSEENAATKDEAEDWLYKADSKSIVDMYLKGDRLIIICNDSPGYYIGSSAKSSAMIYDIGDIKNITLLDTFVQSGKYDASRMIGDTLYLISSYNPDGDTQIPVCGREDDSEEIPADHIYSMYENETNRFLVLSAVDTLDHTANTESKSILGGVDDVYCNEDHLYIYTTHYDEKWYDGFRESDSVTETTSQILKVDLDDDITFTAYAEVPGYIDDQYALDEYDGNLRVATTSSRYGKDTNNLFVLDDELSIIGSVTGFADNEQIKAVRYVGETAYVITYEQTDPLFVIDLSKPTDPAILGAAKITGFSTMLVPIDDNTILGLGYHTEDTSYSDMEVQNGVKLALFDVSDKANPKVLDTLVYENCNSVVQYNPKALVYNPDRGDYIIPLNYSKWGTVDFDAEAYWADEEYYGGVLNFKVEDGKLTEIGRYKADCDEVERCAYVGDNIYMTYRDSDNDYELNIDSVPYKK